MPDLADVAVLPAGRELDLLVQEHVFESTWRPVPECAFDFRETHWLQRREYGEVLGYRYADGATAPSGGLRHYSTDDGVAITEVALPLSADARHWWALEQREDGWMAHLRRWHETPRGGWVDVASEFGETLALAICRTALAAKVAT